jgi:protein-disulfide isomerase
MVDDTTRRALVAGAVTAAAGGGLYVFSRSGGKEDVTDRDGGEGGGGGGVEDESEDGGEGAGSISPSFHTDEGNAYGGVELAGKPIMGNPDAPVDIHYWMDFQCPFCHEFERDSLPDVYRNHVETGEARVVLTILPVFGEDSMTAATAASCVWDELRDDDPSTYWDWHTAVMAEQDGRNTGWASAESLVEITRSVDGVEAGSLEDCLGSDDAEAFAEEVRRRTERAGSLGIRGTPGFVFHDKESGRTQKLSGAQPPEMFEGAMTNVAGSDET